jgi:hypothetical protein
MFMRLLMLCSLIALSTNLSAQAPPTGPKITSQTVSLTVTTAAMPKPSLKYTLLPSYDDLSSGDALGSYLKCFAEQSNLYFSKEGNELFEKSLNAKLADLPEGSDTFGGRSLQNADVGARLDHIDWISVTPIKRDGINTLLPEVQWLRRVATALKIRARGQVKAGKFSESVYTVQTIFAFGRHLDQHPTVIANTVAVAIVSLAFQPLEEMAEQAGSPNLFWAYAYLPKPMIDYHRGLEGERFILKYEFSGFDDRNVVWDDETTTKAVLKLQSFIQAITNQQETEEKKIVRGWFQSKLNDSKWLEGCRTRLIGWGYDAAKVAKYPKEQLVLHDVLRKYDVLRDDFLKYSKLSNVQYEALDLKAPSTDDDENILTNYLLQANFFIPRFRIVTLRLSQRFALLQTVEAIRDYAAQNDGKLPTALKDIKLPLPLDPVNDKPLEYTLKNGKATLKGAIPKLSTKDVAWQEVIYEIQVKK